MAFVELNKVWVKYGDTIAVRGLSLTIPKGSVFGFIGPNGAGKTSTIKVLATLLAPALGTALINGISVRRNPSGVRRIIGYMPDFFGVYDDLTVSEYLHFFAAAYRMDRRKRRSVVVDVLSLTDLTEKRDTPVDALSRGMKRRLTVAGALVHSPQVVFLDEPTSGLDVPSARALRSLIKAINRDGTTVFLTTHNLAEAESLCGRWSSPLCTRSCPAKVCWRVRPPGRPLFMHSP